MTLTFERFTDRARKAMQLATIVAHKLNHDYLATAHVLLGLLEEGVGVAANTLLRLGVSLDAARAEVLRLVEPGPEPFVGDGKLPRTPRTDRCLKYAVSVSDKLKHNYVGTEHMLLGLISEPEGEAAQVLINLGLTLSAVEAEIVNLLGAAAAGLVKCCYCQQPLDITPEGVTEPAQLLLGIVQAHRVCMQRAAQREWDETVTFWLGAAGVAIGDGGAVLGERVGRHGMAAALREVVRRYSHYGDIWV